MPGFCGTARAKPLEVFVGIPPQAYLVERIGGEHVVVHVLMQSGQDPHTFEATPRQIMALRGAELFLTVGMPLESRLAEKIRGSGARLTVVDTARGIPRQAMAAAGEHDHGDDHGHDHHHDVGEADPHVWLAPPLAKTLATNVADALCRADPAHADDYRRRLATLKQDLDAVHAEIDRILRPYRGRPFYVFHPAFGYFGATYGLKQESVESGGKLPAPRQLRALIKQAKAEQVKILFVQPQFDQRTAAVVAELIGGAVVPIDPLAKDLLDNFHEIAAKIEGTLSPR
ncbi:MAG: zinc ABC transporter substrate-binding protein [Pirellulales bacterium]|nr:zinc ABC transporter substrate-binding protein [Pirellulales bacterium]